MRIITRLLSAVFGFYCRVFWHCGPLILNIQDGKVFMQNRRIWICRASIKENGQTFCVKAPWRQVQFSHFLKHNTEKKTLSIPQRQYCYDIAHGGTVMFGDLALHWIKLEKCFSDCHIWNISDILTLSLKLGSSYKNI